MLFCIKLVKFDGLDLETIFFNWVIFISDVSINVLLIVKLPPNKDLSPIKTLISFSGI